MVTMKWHGVFDRDGERLDVHRVFEGDDLREIHDDIHEVIAIREDNGWDFVESFVEELDMGGANGDTSDTSGSS